MFLTIEIIKFTSNKHGFKIKITFDELKSIIKFFVYKVNCLMFK